MNLTDYGNLIGSSPVWAGLYATFDPRRQAFHIEPGAPRTEYGWRIKVLWIVAPKLIGRARVHGGELASGAPLSFEIEEQGSGPASSATLDPAKPGVPPSTNGFKEFPSYVYFPRAGCYWIEAEWPSGRWRLVFGAGR